MAHGSYANIQVVWKRQVKKKKKQTLSKRQTVSPKASASQRQFYSGLVCWVGGNRSTAAQSVPDTDFDVEV